MTEATPSKCPEPGIYPNVLPETYFSWEAISNSAMNHLMVSPAHLKAYWETPPKDTPAFILGRATHAAILEPEDFPKLYGRGPELPKNTKAGKEAWAEALASGQEVLKAADFDMCLAMRDSVQSNRSASTLISGNGQCELSIVWDDPETGVRCKARIDRLSPEIAGGTIVDLKSTRDASKRNFSRAIFTYGYHRQGAFYLAGAKALDIPVNHYSILAVENTEPCAVASYRLDEYAIAGGMEQIQPMLELYRQCLDSDKWPGYPEEVQDISLPAYAWNQLEDEKNDV